MAKKTATKKKSATTARKPKPRANAGHAQAQTKVSVGGNIIADTVVMHDQTNTINRAGRDVVSGDVTNLSDQRTVQVTNAQEWVTELEKVKAELAALKQHAQLTPAEARRLVVVEGDVQEALGEAHQPTPVGERINHTLDGAKDTLEKLGGSVAAALALGTTLGTLGQMALKVFGG